MEIKKDALRGVRFGAYSRMLACFLAVALSAGMVPAGAFAYAADGEGQGQNQGQNTSQDGGNSNNSGNTSASADRVNEDVVLDTSGVSGSSGSSGGASSDSGDTVTGDAAASDSETGAAGSESDAASGSATASANRYTSSANGQTSADVSLAGDATVGTIEYNGLAYTIDPDDPTVVSVTGIASSAPKGDIVIPSQVACGNQLYTVAKIARGGGYLR